MSDSTIEVISRGVFLWQGDLLVCRNRKLGHTFLPGGHVEKGERATAALKREMMEEAGVSLQVGRFIGACEASFQQQRKSNKGVRYHHELNLLFALHPDSQTALAFDPHAIRSMEEAIEFLWLPLKQIESDTALLLPHGVSSLVLGSQTQAAPAWVCLFEAPSL
ncbi:MAG: NUDIX domain-containing protein [Phycisphaeraceae bacterium]